VPDGVPQLWHGYGPRTWEVVAAGAAAGHDVRVGFEDVLVVPDGRTASSKRRARRERRGADQRRPGSSRPSLRRAAWVSR
jgi:uncharacterized protein (DUF849 family)